MNFKIFHMGGLIKVTLFTSTTCKKLFKHFSFYLLTFLSWTFCYFAAGKAAGGSLQDMMDFLSDITILQSLLWGGGVGGVSGVSG